MRRHLMILVVLAAFLLHGPLSVFGATIFVDQGCAADSTTYEPTLAYPDRCEGNGTETMFNDYTDTRAGNPGHPSAGDDLILRAGTYNKYIAVHGDPTRNLNDIPSGTSMATATRVAAYATNVVPGCDPRGTLEEARLCYGNTYEEVIVTGINGTTGASIGLIGESPEGGGAQIEFIVFEGLILDGSVNGTGKNGITLYVIGGNCAAMTRAPNDLRFLNVEVRNWGNQGALAHVTTEDVEWLNMHVHHNGVESTDHGLYFSGQRHLVDGGEYHHNYQYGLHNYHNHNAGCATPHLGNDSIIQNVRSYANRIGMISSNAVQNTTVRNSLFYGNSMGGMHVGTWQGDNKKIYNNTIWNNGGFGMRIDGSNNFPPAQIIRNNVVTSFTVTSGSQTPQRVITHNWTSSPPSDGSWVVGSGEPMFVDPSSGDFRLRDGAPLIDVGVTLAEVPVDFAGTSRPQGAGYDIGAYERGTGTPTPFDFALTNEWGDAGLEATVEIGNPLETDVTATTVSGTGASVSFTALNLPQSVTPSFSQASCTATCTSTLTLTVGVDAPSGRHPITVRATSGGITRSTSFNLDISCP